MTQSETPPEARGPGQPAPFSLELPKIIATGSLTTGSFFLSAFGIMERVVGFEVLAGGGGNRLGALLPGAAALSFLASTRAMTSLYIELNPALRRRLPNRILARLTAFNGAYGLFILIVSALVGLCASLALSLAFPGLGPAVISAAIAFGLLAFAITFAGALVRPTPYDVWSDIGLVVAILLVMSVKLSSG